TIDVLRRRTHSSPEPGSHSQRRSVNAGAVECGSPSTTSCTGHSPRSRARMNVSVTSCIGEDPPMGRFDYTSADGTRVVGWRNLAAADHLPVVISNGLGTPPTAWPTVVRNGGGFRVATWYYRGTGGGDRPADESRLAIEDHVADMLALMDNESIDQALIACWSRGVNVGFEFARAHPERVA